MRPHTSLMFAAAGLTLVIWSSSQLGMVRYGMAEADPSTSWMLLLAAVGGSVATVVPQFRPIWEMVRGWLGKVITPEQEETLRKDIEAMSYLAHRLQGVVGAAALLDQIWKLLGGKLFASEAAPSPPPSPPKPAA